MMKFKYIFLGLALMVLSNGCQKDVISSETTVTIPGPFETIESSVSGLVTDQEGIALADVSVQYRGVILKTDENGYFKFNDALAVFDGELLKFNREGYFKNYKWFYPQLNDNAFVRVIMVTERFVGDITNSEGGTVTLNGGATVSFPPGALAGPDGEYKVYGHWYDPTGARLTEEMPGDLRAIDTEEALVQLATYGMVAVEIRDAEGNDIQLKENTLATIEFPLPAELAENASETIKTWSFEEDRGYWIEEGTATLVDGKYVAQISHFSFWNCDAPFPVIHLTGRLVNQDGVQLPSVKICITDLDRSNTRSGWTSYAGVFAGKIPKDTPLKLVAKDECNGVIYEGEIGPFAEDADLGDLTADIGNFVFVSGTLLCDGAPLTNGYALIAIPGGKQFVAELDAEGNFEINLPYCELGRILIKGYNLDDNSTIDWIEYEDFESELLAGAIEMCDEDTTNLDEFIRYKFNNGQDLLLVSPEAILINGQLRILDSDEQLGNVTLLIDNPQEGDVTMKRISANMVNPSLGGECGSASPSDPSCDGASGTIEAPYTAIVGDYIKGNFMATLVSANGETLVVMGRFEVRLDKIINESLISGFVWEDTTNDGIRDGADMTQSPPNFSLVSLYKDGASVDEVFTRPGDGYYSFSVEAGLYQLSFTKPGGYIFVQQGAGTDDKIDSDVNPDTGTTDVIDVDGISAYNFDVGLFWTGDLDCNDIDIRTVNASCGNENGSYSLTVNSQDSLEWDGYILETNGNNHESEIDFFPWVSVDELEGGDYTYTLYDPQGDIICSDNFTIEDPGLDCSIFEDIDCVGTSYFGSIAIWCPTSNAITVEWETGQTGQETELPAPGFYNLTITDNTACTAEYTADFSVFPEPILQGTVWLDSILGAANVFDDFDIPLENITVSLYSSNATNLIDVTQTNENGNYSFPNVETGIEYQIQVNVPDIYELVEKEDPDNPNLISDSDIDPETRLSDPFTLDCQEIRSIMIGFRLQ